MKASIRSIKVDLPVDVEELFSPLPNGAKFNWPAMLNVAASSVEAVPHSSQTKFSLIRSPQLTQEEWQVAREANKALSLKSALEPSKVEKASQDVELAGEGD
ncbi:MAG: hypothetical protein H0U78_01400 [Rickettsiaceae bacterium]|nr:hypothetical protein [Rickettsiaceae bacterium]